MLINCGPLVEALDVIKMLTKTNDVILVSYRVVVCCIQRVALDPGELVEVGRVGNDR